MIGKISNNSLAFKRAYFSPCKIRVKGENPEEDYTTTLKNPKELERLALIQEELDRLSEINNVNIIVDTLINENAIPNQKIKYRDFSLEYTIFDKNNHAKNKGMYWTHCKDDNNDHLDKIKHAVLTSIKDANE